MWSLFSRPELKFRVAKFRVDRLVSLGALCEAAFQLRRLARSDRAYPFDWWITPLAAVAPVLEAGAGAVFARERIVKVADYDGAPALYSRLSGTVHLHEFPAGTDILALDEAEIAARLVPKYDALHGRMEREAAQGTTLFVRQCLPAHDPQGEALEEAVDGLYAALSRLAGAPLLLLLDYEPVRPRPWLITARVPACRDHNDLGSRRGWNHVFHKAGIAVGRSGGRFGFNDLVETFASAPKTKTKSKR
ncbi:DUF1796 family putative cysteine peptidase [Xanthobacter sp. DSM 14520]|uniref:DUF1796 family putative cysteine peptidase n=1 Tax=Xanthobacter autotrophicus (strain ATCC BAA-1158 / Py2) TaxID=78245 RepID=UPI00372B7E06